MPKGGEFILPAEKLPDIFTIDGLSEDQKMIRDNLRRFMAEFVLPKESSGRIESKEPGLMRELIQKLARKTELLGLEIPEQFGGGGLGAISSTVVTEEIDKQGSFAVSVLAHKGIGTWPIMYFGTPEQKQKYLPQLATGEWVAAYSLTETGAGSDANSVRLTAEKVEGGYLLNGEKIFVTNGGFADVFTVFAKLNGKLTAFIVEKVMPGFKVGKEEHKMGIQGSSTAILILENVFVPDCNLLGVPGKGFKMAMNILNLGRFSLGAACLGAGRLCLEEASQYARDRKQFGGPIGEFGLIRQKLAKMTALVYAMEAVVYRTAGLLEDSIGQAEPDNTEAILKAISEYVIECSIVKVFCSEALDYIVDENVQIHGGYGFCAEYPAERYYRDSRINRIFEGTNEINRLVIIGSLLNPKKAEQLSLPAVIKNVIEEILGSGLQEEPDNLNQKLLGYLNCARKAILLAGGAVFKKFPPPPQGQPSELEKHQFLLGQLSDCAIDIYVLESVLAAMVNSREGEKKERQESMVRLLFAEKLAAIENQVKNIMAGCAEGDELRTQLSMLRRLLKITPENMETLHNQILGA